MAADRPVMRPVVLAAVTGPHGVAGEVRLKLFGEGVTELRRYKAFNGGTLNVTTLRDDHKGGAVARFVEIEDRTAAEKLRGTALTVPRSALPPLPEGEYYYADLVGLPAVSTSGEALGVVAAVDNFGAGDVLEIEKTAEGGGKSIRFMVPMRPEAVPEWDGERLVVADGWAEA